MAIEQLTLVSGRVAQDNNAKFFLMNLADIAAADIMNVESAFGTTSLRDFLIFQNPDMSSTDYDLYVDKNNIIVNTSGSNTSAKLGIAILGSMVLGNE